MGKPFGSRPPRVPFARALRLTPLGDDQAALDLHAANLSRGGMFIRADRALSRGTRVALALAAGGALLDFAEAEVVWDGSSGFGLRFTQLRPRSLALVEHLVARGGTANIAPAPPKKSSRRRAKWKPAVAALALAAVAALIAFPWPRRPPEPAVSMPAVAVAVAIAAPPPTVPAVVQAPALLAAREAEIEIPTGAVRALRITITNQEVAVEPTLRRNAVIKRIFNLARPPRLVIDVVGREPRYSWQLEGNNVVKSVRVGARDHGTRVVVDLPDPLHELQPGYTLVATRIRPVRARP